MWVVVVEEDFEISPQIRRAPVKGIGRCCFVSLLMLASRTFQ